MIHRRWALSSICILLLLAACGEDKEPAKPATGVGFGDGINIGGNISDGDVTTGEDAAAGEDTAAAAWKKCEVEGGWGCSCKTGDDCDSGYCIEADEGLMCTKTCVDSCPPDWHCRQASAGDAVFICLPKYVSLCRPCAAHSDCSGQGQQVGTAKCVPMDLGGGFINGSFCGASCDKDTPCPNEYSCKEISLPGEATVGQCQPDKNDCTCSQQETKLALSTGCKRENEFGTCNGQRKCSTEGLTLCDAAVPTVEVCDGEDNDCDGKTDEEDAVGCKVYFPDNDGDGAGTGAGQCMCNNPGPGFAATGGDCNDIAKTINPGAKEVCNDIDDNCNSATDEPGASGCSVFYKDKDGDTFGDPDDAACVCPSKKPADLISQAGDCDDNNPKVKPGATEKCNQIDDNCNAKTDEEDSEGCKLYYIDIDKDTYGPSDKSKCLCGPDALHTADKPGDCDDNNPKIKPTQLEICNNVDDDCNSTTDDGDAAKSCPKVAGVDSACNAGKCTIATCPKGYFDVDGQYTNGCECLADNMYGVEASSCKAAKDIGAMPDGGSKHIVSGNVMPKEGGDWFKFHAKDNPDVNNCDSFHVRARFIKNPGNIFQLDLYRGSCAGANQLCSNETDVSWTVAFGGKPPFGVHTKPGKPMGKVVKSPTPLPGGECKCSSKGGASGPGAPGMNQCVNNSATFWVHVHLAKGKAPVCVAYQVELSNGAYSPK
ncbi:MAG: putative metal-binding motif-containing protein [Myxococcales bacterium]|nr:putative metal-binding motif-containing protein [Myxococcales bacterium]